MMSELLQFESGVHGLVLNLEDDQVGVVILGNARSVGEGVKVKTTGRVIDVPVGEAVLGRVVTALGEPQDGKGAIKTKARRPIESPAPSVVEREPVHQPLQTGI